MDAPRSRQQEFFSIKFVQAVVCEFVATAIFIFIALGSAFKWPSERTSIVQISLSFGLTICTLVQVFGHVCGAHLNPAVTVAYFVGNQISVTRLVLYVGLQLLGAIIGAGVLYTVTPADVCGTLSLNDLYFGVSPEEALVMEIILTFTVVMCVFSSTDKRRTDSRSNSAISIGLAFTMAHLTGIRYTGCSINPARSFGPAVIMGTFSEAHWVFWVGPLFGASLASVTYNYLLYPHKLSMEERMAIVKGLFMTDDDGGQTLETEMDHNLSAWQTRT